MMPKWTEKPSLEQMQTFLSPWSGQHALLVVETQGTDATRYVSGDDVQALTSFVGNYRSQRAHISPAAYAPDRRVAGAAVVYVVLHARTDEEEARARERLAMQLPKPSTLVYVPSWKLAATWSLTSLAPFDDQYQALVQRLAQMVGGIIPSAPRDLLTLVPGGSCPVAVAGNQYGSGGTREQHVRLEVTDTTYDYSDLLTAAGSPEPRAKSDLFPASVAQHIGGGIGGGWR